MRRTNLASATLSAACLMMGAPAMAEEFSARLSGFQEVPAAILSAGKGTLDLRLDRRAQSVTYQLTYSGLGSQVTQAHIHFGKVHVAGGIFVFLCTNLNNGPANTPACPTAGGTVTGTLTAASVLAVSAHNIPAGDFNVILAALDSDTAYGNVHTIQFAAGEIRGQVRRGDTGN
jgi:hypothetical protein